MTTPQYLLEQNQAWSDRMQAESPALFSDLTEGQSPDVLWIGCADSRVPPTQVVDEGPGDLFVHRNVANVVDEGDPNSMSVVKYAVEALEVSHIIVCGHYRCGGVQAVLEDDTPGVLGEWLAPVRTVVDRHADTLDSLDEQARWDRSCELNVEAQVQRIAQTSVVQQAWARGQDLALHGWIYQLSDGRLRDLNVEVTAASNTPS